MTDHMFHAGGQPLARVRRSDSPIVAVALHAGHAARASVAAHFALSEEERLREEDPFTAQMAPDGVGLVEVLRSRFEVDLNRPRFRSVYQGPKDAWGLDVWHDELPDSEDRISRSVYDAFYALMFDELSRLAQHHGRFVVLDLHSYNHRRGGPDEPAADASENPEVNVGTRRIDRSAWGPLIDDFIAVMRGRGLQVEENVKFGGGHFVEWVERTFPGVGCGLAIEFKKTYMDEWTGVLYDGAVESVREALETAASALRRSLEPGSR